MSWRQHHQRRRGRLRASAQLPLHAREARRETHKFGENTKRKTKSRDPRPRARSQRNGLAHFHRISRLTGVVSVRKCCDRARSHSRGSLLLGRCCRDDCGAESRRDLRQKSTRPACRGVDHGDSAFAHAASKVGRTREVVPVRLSHGRRVSRSDQVRSGRQMNLGTRRQVRRQLDEDSTAHSTTQHVSIRHARSCALDSERRSVLQRDLFRNDRC